MSQESERVYTINLGKVKLSQSQHRSVRAINMIREFARHHMKVETIKIDEDLAHEVWAKGVRSPPRKVRVIMSKTDEGHVLVSSYDKDAEEKISPEKETTKISDNVDPVTEEPATEPPKEPAKPPKDDTMEEPAKPTKEDAKPSKDDTKPTKEELATAKEPSAEPKEDTAKPKEPSAESKEDTAKPKE